MEISRHGNICVNAPYTTHRAGRVSKTGLEIRKTSTVVFGRAVWEKARRDKREEATAALLRPFWCLMELSIQTREDETAAAER